MAKGLYLKEEVGFKPKKEDNKKKANKEKK